MNPQQVRELVAETFPQVFDKARFRIFAINLLNKIDESKAQSWNASYVKDAFKPHVARFERLGTYTSPDDDKLDVLVVHLTSESKLERARTAIRNFVADHLKTRDNKDAALVAFVSPTEKQWRFSYVKMEYAAVETKTGKVGVETRLTPARRFSYIVGEGESCHTAQSRFLALLQDTESSPTLAQIEDAFNVEAVSEEFYNQYATLFSDIEATLQKLIAKVKSIASEFKKKNISTVDFAKKLMGQIVFLYFLQKKGWLGVEKGKDWGAGPHDFLRQLANGKYGNFFNDILEPLFYDTLATDRGHEAWCKMFKCRIPFLNGGLFEPLGDYDWRKTDIILPNELFTNSKKTDSGDIGTGVLDVFDRYNFTVNEAEPLEKEVAIDPEMLGKVFENLIEDNRRKGLGSFYTPREIVHYMCQESIINYLDTAINKDKDLVPRADLETFVHLGDQISHYEAVETRYSVKMPKCIDKQARLIDEKLADISVCDPAVGSGAFPVGMMTEIVRARSALTPYFNDVHDRTPYHFKRHAIQNCLYGVDIDPGAAEIAKLRLWLSLVVDEEDVKQIKPLPNLNYKIVVGNSLISFPFKSQRLGEIENLKERYYDELIYERRVLLKQEIDRKLAECFASSKRSLGYEVNFDFEVYFSEVFHKKGGFDVVIANPPYGAEFSDLQITECKRFYESFALRAESYVLFIEAGVRRLMCGGTLSYIVPDTYLNLGFTQRLRSYLLRNTMLREIYLLPPSIFDSATVDTTLLFAEKVIEHDPYFPTEVRIKCHKKQRQLVSMSNPDREFYAHTADWHKSSSFNIASEPRDLAVISRMEKCTMQISYVAEIFSGIKVYEVGKGRPPQTEMIRDERLFTSTVKQNESFQPLYDGKHIARYSVLWRNNNWINYGPWLAAPRKSELFEGEKILIRKIVGDQLLATYVSDTVYCNTLLFVLKLSNENFISYKSMLGIINSQLIGWYYRKKFQISDEDTFPQIMIRDILQFPLPQIPNERRDVFDALVDRILMEKRRNTEADTSMLEQELDQLVFALYQLTPEEIKIVEESTRRHVSSLRLNS